MFVNYMTKENFRIRETEISIDVNGYRDRPQFPVPTYLLLRKKGGEGGRGVGGWREIKSW